MCDHGRLLADNHSQTSEDKQKLLELFVQKNGPFQQEHLHEEVQEELSDMLDASEHQFVLSVDYGHLWHMVRDRAKRRDRQQDSLALVCHSAIVYE